MDALVSGPGGLGRVAKLRVRGKHAGGRRPNVDRTRRYYISDLGGGDAQAMLGYVRGHWGIENRLHWSLDVTFREDTLRNRVGHSPENFSRIRRLALNLLRQDKSCKAGIKGKRLQACLREDYLLKVLYQKV